MPEADLLNIAIHKNYQGKGFGTQAIRAVCDLMKRNGVQKIFLEVRSGTPAVKFYEKNEFKKIDLRKKYYDNIEDTVIMQYVV